MPSMGQRNLPPSSGGGLGIAAIERRGTGAVAAAELAKIVVVQVADSNAYSGGAQGVAAVQHEDAVVIIHHDVVGIGETTTVEAVVYDADGLDVVQGNIGGCGRSHGLTP